MVVSSSALASPVSSPTRVEAPRVEALTIEALVSEHGAFVWRSVKRLGVAAGDIDDVTQLVFLRARERIAEIPADGAKGFLYRLALGIASNHKRSQRRRRETSLEEGDDGRVSRDDPAAQVEQRALLDRLLEPLPMELRAVLVLHEGEELTVPEIAELLGIPAGTVASRLRRARDEVKAALLRARARSAALGGRR